MLGIEPMAIITGLAIAVVLVVVGAWLLGRRRGRGSGRPSFGREESISYFRDLSGRGGPSVRDEEEVGRWGQSERAEDQYETKSRK